MAISDDDNVLGVGQLRLACQVHLLLWDSALGEEVILCHAHGVLAVHVRREGVAGCVCVCVSGDGIGWEKIDK